MKIEKAPGITCANEMTCVRLQEIIYGFSRQAPLGKVVIDGEKIIFYKFHIKLAIARHSVSGIECINGQLSYGEKGFNEWGIPFVRDTLLLTELLKLFNFI